MIPPDEQAGPEIPRRSRLRLARVSSGIGRWGLLLALMAALGLIVVTLYVRSAWQFLLYPLLIGLLLSALVALALDLLRRL
jgi:hypothetical protein